jgi:hypothetical protein
MSTLHKHSRPARRWLRPALSRAPYRTGGVGAFLLKTVRLAGLVLGAVMACALTGTAPAMAQQAGSAMAPITAGSAATGLLHQIQARGGGETNDKDGDKNDKDDNAEKNDAGDDDQDRDRKCGRGLYLSNGHCCARGTSWNGKRCLRRPTLLPICPRGTSGTYPDCQARGDQVCPPGTRGRWPNCQTTQVCPSGTVGAPPNCQYLRGRSGPIARTCPPGTTGVPPVCRRVGTTPCPGGTVGSAGRCLVLQPMRPVPTIRSPTLTRPPTTRAPTIGSGANTRPLWR